MEGQTPGVIETPTTPVTPEVHAESTPTEPNAATPTASEIPSEQTPAFSEDVIIEGVKFGEYEVEVSIPSDIANFTAEKGIDAKAVSEELYASDDLTLSEETMTKLYDAFGKWQVDSYLSGLKAKNDLYMQNYKSGEEAKSAAEKAAWDSTLEIMGGEDRWDDLSAYAVKNLSDEELDEFNQVMETGTLKMQQLFIRELYSKFAEAGAPVAPQILDIEDGSNVGGGDEGAPLSADEYRELLITGKYKENPELYDKLRRAGIAKGL